MLCSKPAHFLISLRCALIIPTTCKPQSRPVSHQLNEVSAAIGAWDLGLRKPYQRAYLHTNRSEAPRRGILGCLEIRYAMIAEVLDLLFTLDTRDSMTVRDAYSLTLYGLRSSASMLRRLWQLKIVIDYLCRRERFGNRRRYLVVLKGRSSMTGESDIKGLGTTLR